VKEVLALALEARSAIGHDTLSLRGTNLAAEVGLAGLAELAFLAFWGASRGSMLVLKCSYATDGLPKIKPRTRANRTSPTIKVFHTI
jgi:hypothetical protein